MDNYKITERPFVNRHERLIDYFVVLGPKIGPDGVLERETVMERTDSFSILPLADLFLATDKHPPPLDGDFGQVQTISGQSGLNLNPGLFKSPTLFYVSRKQAPNAHPITDIIITTEKNEKKTVIPPTAVKVNRKSFGNDNNIYLVRDPRKQPLVDILFIDPTKEQCPLDYLPLETPLQKWILCVKRRSVAVADADQDGQVVTASLRHRVPRLDHPDHDLDDRGLSALCFPRGIIISAIPQPPSFMSFVITRPDGSEVYATSLTIYDRVPLKNLQDDTGYKDFVKMAQQLQAIGNNAQHVFFPTALVILSRWPFYSSFKQVLIELNNIGSRFHVEPQLRTLLLQTQLPRPGLRTVSFVLNNSQIVFNFLPKMAIPQVAPESELTLQPLFQALSIPNLITVWRHVLTEGRVIVFSQDYKKLTKTLDALRSLIFPLRWQCVFIPILPTSMAFTVRAPFPFLVGVHKSFLEDVQLNQDILLVGLDRNELRLPRPNVKKADEIEDLEMPTDKVSKGSAAVKTNKSTVFIPDTPSTCPIPLQQTTSPNGLALTPTCLVNPATMACPALPTELYAQLEKSLFESIPLFGTKLLLDPPKTNQNDSEPDFFHASQAQKDTIVPPLRSNLQGALDSRGISSPFTHNPTYITSVGLHPAVMKTAVLHSGQYAVSVSVRPGPGAEVSNDHEDPHACGGLSAGQLRELSARLAFLRVILALIGGYRVLLKVRPKLQPVHFGSLCTPSLSSLGHLIGYDGINLFTQSYEQKQQLAIQQGQQSGQNLIQNGHNSLNNTHNNQNDSTYQERTYQTLLQSSTHGLNGTSGHGGSWPVSVLAPGGPQTSPQSSTSTATATPGSKSTPPPFPHTPSLSPPHTPPHTQLSSFHASLLPSQSLQIANLRHQVQNMQDTTVANGDVMTPQILSHLPHWDPPVSREFRSSLSAVSPESAVLMEHSKLQATVPAQWQPFLKKFLESQQAAELIGTALFPTTGRDLPDTHTHSMPLPTLCSHCGHMKVIENVAMVFSHTRYQTEVHKSPYQLTQAVGVSKRDKKQSKQEQLASLLTTANTVSQSHQILFLDLCHALATMPSNSFPMPILAKLHNDVNLSGLPNFSAFNRQAYYQSHAFIHGNLAHQSLASAGSLDDFLNAPAPTMGGRGASAGGQNGAGKGPGGIFGNSTSQELPQATFTTIPNIFDGFAATQSTPTDAYLLRYTSGLGYYGHSLFVHSEPLQHRQDRTSALFQRTDIFHQDGTIALRQGGQVEALGAGGSGPGRMSVAFSQSQASQQKMKQQQQQQQQQQQMRAMAISEEGEEDFGTGARNTFGSGTFGPNSNSLPKGQNLLQNGQNGVNFNNIPGGRATISPFSSNGPRPTTVSGGSGTTTIDLAPTQSFVQSGRSPTNRVNQPISALFGNFIKTQMAPGRALSPFGMSLATRWPMALFPVDAKNSLDMQYSVKWTHTPTALKQCTCADFSARPLDPTLELSISPDSAMTVLEQLGRSAPSDYSVFVIPPSDPNEQEQNYQGGFPEIDNEKILSTFPTVKTPPSQKTISIFSPTNPAPATIYIRSLGEAVDCALDALAPHLLDLRNLVLNETIKNQKSEKYLKNDRIFDPGAKFGWAVPIAQGGTGRESFYPSQQELDYASTNSIPANIIDDTVGNGLYKNASPNAENPLVSQSLQNLHNSAQNFSNSQNSQNSAQNSTQNFKISTIPPPPPPPLSSMAPSSSASASTTSATSPSIGNVDLYSPHHLTTNENTENSKNSAQNAQNAQNSTENSLPIPLWEGSGHAYPLNTSNPAFVGAQQSIGSVYELWTWLYLTRKRSATSMITDATIFNEGPCTKDCYHAATQAQLKDQQNQPPSHSHPQHAQMGSIASRLGGGSANTPQSRLIKEPEYVTRQRAQLSQIESRLGPHPHAQRAQWHLVMWALQQPEHILKAKIERHLNASASSWELATSATSDLFQFIHTNTSPATAMAPDHYGNVQASGFGPNGGMLSGLVENDPIYLDKLLSKLPTPTLPHVMSLVVSLRIAAHNDLLVCIGQLHEMLIRRILPTSGLVFQLCLFCAYSGLELAFQSLYRLLGGFCFGPDYDGATHGFEFMKDLSNATKQRRVAQNSLQSAPGGPSGPPGANDDYLNQMMKHTTHIRVPSHSFRLGLPLEAILALAISSRSHFFNHMWTNSHALTTIIRHQTPQTTTMPAEFLNRVILSHNLLALPQFNKKNIKTQLKSSCPETSACNHQGSGGRQVVGSGEGHLPTQMPSTKSFLKQQFPGLMLSPSEQSPTSNPTCIPYPALIWAQAQCSKCANMMSGADILSGYSRTENVTDGIECTVCGNYVRPKIITVFDDNDICAFYYCSAYYNIPLPPAMLTRPTTEGFGAGSGAALLPKGGNGGQNNGQNLSNSIQNSQNFAQNDQNLPVECVLPSSTSPFAQTGSCIDHTGIVLPHQIRTYAQFLAKQHIQPNSLTPAQHWQTFKSYQNSSQNGQNVLSPDSSCTPSLTQDSTIDHDLFYAVRNHGSSVTTSSQATPIPMQSLSHTSNTTILPSSPTPAPPAQGTSQGTPLGMAMPSLPPGAQNNSKSAPTQANTAQGIASTERVVPLWIEVDMASPKFLKQTIQQLLVTSKFSPDAFLYERQQDWAQLNALTPQSEGDGFVDGHCGSCCGGQNGQNYGQNGQNASQNVHDTFVPISNHEAIKTVSQSSFPFPFTPLTNSHHNTIFDPAFNFGQGNAFLHFDPSSPPLPVSAPTSAPNTNNSALGMGMGMGAGGMGLGSLNALPGFSNYSGGLQNLQQNSNQNSQNNAQNYSHTATTSAPSAPPSIDDATATAMGTRPSPLSVLRATPELLWSACYYFLVRGSNPLPHFSETLANNANKLVSGTLPLQPFANTFANASVEGAGFGSGMGEESEGQNWTQNGQNGQNGAKLFTLPANFHLPVHFLLHDNYDLVDLIKNNPTTSDPYNTAAGTLPGSIWSPLGQMAQNSQNSQNLNENGQNSAQNGPSFGPIPAIKESKLPRYAISQHPGEAWYCVREGSYQCTAHRNLLVQQIRPILFQLEANLAQNAQNAQNSQNSQNFATTSLLLAPSTPTPQPHFISPHYITHKPIMLAAAALYAQIESGGNSGQNQGTSQNLGQNQQNQQNSLKNSQNLALKHVCSERLGQSFLMSTIDNTNHNELESLLKAIIEYRFSNITSPAGSPVGSNSANSSNLNNSGSNLTNFSNSSSDPPNPTQIPFMTYSQFFSSSTSTTPARTSHYYNCPRPVNPLTDASIGASLVLERSKNLNLTDSHALHDFSKHRLTLLNALRRLEPRSTYSSTAHTIAPFVYSWKRVLYGLLPTKKGQNNAQNAPSGQIPPPPPTPGPPPLPNSPPPLPSTPQPTPQPLTQAPSQSQSQASKQQQQSLLSSSPLSSTPFDPSVPKSSITFADYLSAPRSRPLSHFLTHFQSILTSLGPSLNTKAEKALQPFDTAFSGAYINSLQMTESLWGPWDLNLGQANGSAPNLALTSTSPLQNPTHFHLLTRPVSVEIDTGFTRDQAANVGVDVKGLQEIIGGLGAKAKKNVTDFAFLRNQLILLKRLAKLEFKDPDVKDRFSRNGHVYPSFHWFYIIPPAVVVKGGNGYNGQQVISQHSAPNSQNLQQIVEFSEKCQNFTPTMSPNRYALNLYSNDVNYVTVKALDSIFGTNTTVSVSEPMQQPLMHVELLKNGPKNDQNSQNSSQNDQNPSPATSIPLFLPPPLDSQALAYRKVLSWRPDFSDQTANSLKTAKILEKTPFLNQIPVLPYHRSSSSYVQFSLTQFLHQQHDLSLLLNTAVDVNSNNLLTKHAFGLNSRLHKNAQNCSNCQNSSQNSSCVDCSNPTLSLPTPLHDCFCSSNPYTNKCVTCLQCAGQSSSLLTGTTCCCCFLTASPLSPPMSLPVTKRHQSLSVPIFTLVNTNTQVNYGGANQELLMAQQMYALQSGQAKYKKALVIFQKEFGERFGAEIKENLQKKLKNYISQLIILSGDYRTYLPRKPSSNPLPAYPVATVTKREIYKGLMEILTQEQIQWIQHAIHKHYDLSAPLPPMFNNANVPADGIIPSPEKMFPGLLKLVEKVVEGEQNGQNGQNSQNSQNNSQNLDLPPPPPPSDAFAPPPPPPDRITGINVLPPNSPQNMANRGQNSQNWGQNGQNEQNASKNDQKCDKNNTLIDISTLPTSSQSLLPSQLFGPQDSLAPISVPTLHQLLTTSLVGSNMTQKVLISTQNHSEINYPGITRQFLSSFRNFLNLVVYNTCGCAFHGVPMVQDPWWLLNSLVLYRSHRQVVESLPQDHGVPPPPPPDFDPAPQQIQPHPDWTVDMKDCLLGGSKNEQLSTLRDLVGIVITSFNLLHQSEHVFPAHHHDNKVWETKSGDSGPIISQNSAFSLKSLQTTTTIDPLMIPTTHIQQLITIYKSSDLTQSAGTAGSGTLGANLSTFGGKGANNQQNYQNPSSYQTSSNPHSYGSSSMSGQYGLINPSVPSNSNTLVPFNANTIPMPPTSPTNSVSSLNPNTKIYCGVVDENVLNLTVLDGILTIVHGFVNQVYNHWARFVISRPLPTTSDLIPGAGANVYKVYIGKVAGGAQQGPGQGQIAGNFVSSGYDNLPKIAFLGQNQTEIDSINPLTRYQLINYHSQLLTQSSELDLAQQSLMRGWEEYQKSVFDPDFEEFSAFLALDTFSVNRQQTIISKWRALPEYLYCDHSHSTYKDQVAKGGRVLGHLAPLAAQRTALQIGHQNQQNNQNNQNFGPNVPHSPSNTTTTTTTTTRDANGNVTTVTTVKQQVLGSGADGGFQPASARMGHLNVVVGGEGNPTLLDESTTPPPVSSLRSQGKTIQFDYPQGTQQGQQGQQQQQQQQQQLQTLQPGQLQPLQLGLLQGGGPSAQHGPIGSNSHNYAPQTAQTIISPTMTSLVANISSSPAPNPIIMPVSPHINSSNAKLAPSNLQRQQEAMSSSSIGSLSPPPPSNLSLNLNLNQQNHTSPPPSSLLSHPQSPAAALPSLPPLSSSNQLEQLVQQGGFPGNDGGQNGQNGGNIQNSSLTTGPRGFSTKTTFGQTATGHTYGSQASPQPAYLGSPNPQGQKQGASNNMSNAQGTPVLSVNTTATFSNSQNQSQNNQSAQSFPALSQNFQNQYPQQHQHQQDTPLSLHSSPQPATSSGQYLQLPPIPPGASQGPGSLNRGFSLPVPADSSSGNGSYTTSSLSSRSTTPHSIQNPSQYLPSSPGPISGQFPSFTFGQPPIPSHSPQNQQSVYVSQVPAPHSTPAPAPSRGFKPPITQEESLSSSGTPGVFPLVSPPTPASGRSSTAFRAPATPKSSGAFDSSILKQTLGISSIDQLVGGLLGSHGPNATAPASNPSSATDFALPNTPRNTSLSVASDSVAPSRAAPSTPRAPRMQAPSTPRAGGTMAPSTPMSAFRAPPSPSAAAPFALPPTSPPPPTSSAPPAPAPSRPAPGGFRAPGRPPG